uniref:uncharacterized protein LOC122600032 n=1 Tax=Erigeron canadensis TaxID=72917 RepID=UPI001CB891CA|nr:uncharacterized protein LOC122600032 [Erigeron canadensis]
MPKDRRERSLSAGKSRASPYRCSSSHPKRSSIKNPLESEENQKEWEDARCPVCMEHPHNAILLLCSSHNKGCRPYMCDTSYRHSNCFDQFRKSFSEGQPSAALTDEGQQSATSTDGQPSIPLNEAGVLLPALIPEASLTTLNEDKLKAKLLCPLCRGEVNGWVVVDAARVFMNTKTRSCASETCDFFGTYTDLRKHARLVHPLVRPSEADPERQRDWRRMERQRDLGDLLSTLQSSMGEERDEDNTSNFSLDEGGLLTFFFLIRVFRPGTRSRSRSWSETSRDRPHMTVGREIRTRLWGENYSEVSRGVDNESSDGDMGSDASNLLPFSRRRPSPDSDES